MVTAARAEPSRVGAAAVLPYGGSREPRPIAVTGCALSGLVGGAFRPVLRLLLRLWILRLRRRRPLAASAVVVFIRQIGGDDPRG